MIKALGTAALDKLPTVLDHASKIVKNKTVRNILGSDATKTIVQQIPNLISGFFAFFWLIVWVDGINKCGWCLAGGNGC